MMYIRDIAQIISSQPDIFSLGAYIGGKILLFDFFLNVTNCQNHWYLVFLIYFPLPNYPNNNDKNNLLLWLLSHK